MATCKFIVIKEGNEKGKHYKCKPFFSPSHTHTRGTFLLRWQPLLWREPEAECGMAVAKHTEQDRGVLLLTQNRQHARTASGSSHNICLYVLVNLKPQNMLNIYIYIYLIFLFLRLKKRKVELVQNSVINCNGTITK